MSNNTISTTDERIKKFQDEDYLDNGPFSGKKHLVNQVDSPALKVADYHDRIMGFWVITWIHLVKEDLRIFFENGGQMRLLIGIPSSAKSYEALQEAALSAGSETLADYLRTQFIEKINDPAIWKATDAPELFVEAVAAGKIEVKIRPGENIENKLVNKPEHSKLRIFKIKNHTYTVAGSSNDTFAAWNTEKEYNGVASVSWANHPPMVKATKHACDIFEERWKDSLSYPLDEDCILMLENLKKSYLSGSHNEDDIQLEDFEDVESLLLKNKNPTIFCFEPDMKFIENIISNPPFETSKKPQINIIKISQESTQLLLFMLLCDKYEIPNLLFVDDDKSKDLMENQEGYCTSTYSKSELIGIGKSEFDTIDCDNLALYVGLLHNLECEFSLDLLPSQEENEPQSEFWNPSIYTYPYIEKPGDLSMCDHQINAIQIWIDNGYRGIFQHATGTYKTATGLSSAAHLLSKEDCNLVVLSSPYKAVSEQWEELAIKCFRGGGVIVLGCWSDKSDWHESFRRSIKLASEEGKKVLAIFVNNSLWGISQEYKFIQEQLDIYKISGDWALVADEMHNWIGSTNGPANTFVETNLDCKYRLGLTAKIDKMGKENNLQNMKLKQWFAEGKNLLIDTFRLERAILEGFLRSYNYNIEVITIIADDTKASVHGPHEEYYNAISRFKTACEKHIIEQAFEIMKTNESQRMLVYTGPKIVDAEHITDKLADNRTIMQLGEIQKFTSKENSTLRKNIIHEFNAGLTKILVAIKCLDEGVNIPVADTAVLIESDIADDRQWIQRRGRILRKISDNDPPANILDFFPNFITNNRELRDLFEVLQDNYFQRVLEFSMSSTSESQKNLRIEMRKAK